MVAVCTPFDERFPLKSSIELAVMSESFIFPKHAFRLRPDDLYLFWVVRMFGARYTINTFHPIQEEIPGCGPFQGIQVQSS